MISISYSSAVARRVADIVKGKGIDAHRAVLFLLYLQERGADRSWVSVPASKIEEDLLINLQQQIRIRKALKEAGLLVERRTHREGGWGWSPTEFRLTESFRAMFHEEV